LQFREERLAQQRHSVNAQHDLAIVRENLGDTQLQTGKPELAKAEYQKALDIYEALANADPSSGVHQDSVARACYRLATAELRLTDRKSSDRDYRRALKIREQQFQKSQTVGTLKPLMVVQARCGQHAKAAGLAERIQRHPLAGKDPQNLFDVACCYALCMDAVTSQGTSSRPVSEGTPLQHDYATRAVAALKEAIAHGYSDVRGIEMDPDLDPLRGLPAYQTLIGELKNSVAKPSPNSQSAK